jgi:hypothetical protein
MSDLNAYDIACISTYKGLITSENRWFLDTAVTFHMGIHKDCLQNCKTYLSRGVKVGNGQIEPINAVGDFHRMKVSTDGTWPTVILRGFKSQRTYGQTQDSGTRFLARSRTRACAWHVPHRNILAPAPSWEDLSTKAFLLALSPLQH